uniref:Uncharacterized protein n=1 Tax=Anopheles melas TaxID=34690 RepID=A0A182TQX5_9DIPT
MSPKRYCPPTCAGYDHGQTTGKYRVLHPPLSHQQYSWWAVVLPNQCLVIFEFHHAPHPSTSNIGALIDAFQQTGPWIAICCDLLSPKNQSRIDPQTTIRAFAFP